MRRASSTTCAASASTSASTEASWNVPPRSPSSMAVLASAAPRAAAASARALRGTRACASSNAGRSLRQCTSSCWPRHSMSSRFAAQRAEATPLSASSSVHKNGPAPGGKISLERPRGCVTKRRVHSARASRAQWARASQQHGNHHNSKRRRGCAAQHRQAHTAIAHGAPAGCVPLHASGPGVSGAPEPTSTCMGDARDPCPK